MATRWEQYEAYRKRAEHIEPTVFLEHNETKEMLKHSKKISHRVVDTAMPYGVIFDGIYQHEDGRVFELRLHQGGLSLRSRVWASKESLDKHKEAMPFNIWAWG